MIGDHVGGYLHNSIGPIINNPYIAALLLLWNSDISILQGTQIIGLRNREFEIPGVK